VAHDVFISYASEDKPIADAVCAKLEGRGIRCWIAPRDVPPGLPFAKAIVDAISGSRLMVLVFSSNSNSSSHVAREVERAVSGGSPILPLRVEDVLPSDEMEYYLSRQHWLDALTPPLEKHLDRLANAVAYLLTSEQEPTGEEVPAQGKVPTEQATTTQRVARPEPAEQPRDGKQLRDILHAVSVGDEAAVGDLLARRADANAADDKGNTLLHTAARQGYVEIAKLLLDHDADVNATNSDGYTPLHLAARDGRSDAASALLERDADVNAKDDRGFTPMYLACRLGRGEIASQLLDHNADVSAKDSRGYSPLHVARKSGHTEIARLLHEHRALDTTGQVPKHRGSIVVLYPCIIGFAGWTVLLGISLLVPEGDLRAVLFALGWLWHLIAVVSASIHIGVSPSFRDTWQGDMGVFGYVGRQMALYFLTAFILIVASMAVDGAEGWPTCLAFTCLCLAPLLAAVIFGVVRLQRRRNAPEEVPMD